MIIYKQQFRHSDWLKTCQLIPDQRNFISATQNHIQFVLFYHIIKDNERNLCQDLLTIENTDSIGLESARAALCKWATCTRQTFLSKTFAKSLNIQKQYEKNFWDAHSLSIRVQTTINHISIYTFLCFLWQHQHQKKCFLSERELRNYKIRDVCMDFEPYFKVHNLVSVHPKRIILGQMTDLCNLNMIFHVVVSVYRLVKIWN